MVERTVTQSEIGWHATERQIFYNIIHRAKKGYDKMSVTECFPLWDIST